jgi:hypothetical protein
MAFAYAINNIAYLGAGLTKLSGTWSGVAGDASGSVPVSGTVIKADFQKFDNDGTYGGLCRVSSSTSSGITTVTVNNQDNVVSGYFTIEKLG